MYPAFLFLYYIYGKIQRMQQYTEEELVERLRDNTTLRSAFTQVVSMYSEKLYWQIRKMVLSHDDANDLLQNTFMKAWMNIEYFRGDAKLSTWLYKIAINECITFLNRQRATQNVSMDDTDVYLLERLKGDEYFDGDEAQMKLQQAIVQLPEKQRLVFNLKYFEDMKYENMSDILGTSIGALKASYHHAVKKVEDFLTKDL
ncbi:DNA-directed RNA polymerase sigma-70 factor [Bacteroidia bacterium]|nr:DNA-directed RNA polymerase sigma-70 factor [Bacteroidia bacterium]